MDNTGTFWYSDRSIGNCRNFNDFCFDFALLVNVLGAFAIGLIAAAAARHAALSPRMILFLKTGICGGFTTFSTFALETSGLLQAGRLPAAAAYVVLSVLLSVGAVILVQALAG